MILQTEFQKNGYINLLVGESASKIGINIEDIFDSDKMPEELMGLYISEQGDELFFLLNGDSMEINKLCDEWDRKLGIFTMINGRTEATRKFKYNIVQLIVYSGETPDRSIESNLLVSRKMIIKGDTTEKDHIVIADDEAVELPFYAIMTDGFAPDKEQEKKLGQLLPEEDDLVVLLKEQRKKVNRKNRADEQPKYYTKREFETIGEWLEK
jgi:hypothetical protein